MDSRYRIEPARSGFVVIDGGGETVGIYPTEEAAKLDVERAMLEDAMYETAKPLADIAIKHLMQMYKVDRETARYWEVVPAD